MASPYARRVALSLRSRVRLVLAAITVPSVLALAIALATEPSTDAARREVSERLAPARLDVERLHSAMVDQQTGSRGFLLAGDPTFLEPFVAGRKNAAAAVARLRAAMSTDETRRLLDEVVTAKERWEDLADAAVEDRSSDAPSVLFRKERFDEFRAALDRLDRAVTDEVHAAEADYDERRARQRTLLGVTIGLAGILSVVGAYLLTRWLRGPLARLGDELEAAASDPMAGVAVAGPSELAAIATRADALRRTFLEDSRERLRRGLVVAQEEERRRIASGLHDDIIQSLTAVGLRLQALRPSVAPADLDLLDGAADAVGDGIDRLRTLLFELHPPALDRHGLTAALESFGEQLLAGGATAFRVEGDPGSSSLTVQSLAYRAAREAITNAWKHAGATSLVVSIDAGPGWLQVDVVDDGSGFDPAEVAALGRPGHLGLEAAEELVVGSMGQWMVHSAPGEGTSVSIWLPDPEGA